MLFGEKRNVGIAHQRVPVIAAPAPIELAMNHGPTQASAGPSERSENEALMRLFS
jgi:hypothetical protein